MENNSTVLKQELLNLLVKYAYQEGDFTLSSGQKSNFYLNCKQVTLRAEGALLVGKLIFSLLTKNTTAVAGLTLGADPIVTAVSLVSALENKPIPALIVRKEAKGHGTQAYIEGPSLPSGSNVVVLEDVVTTGKSAMLAVERLRGAGYHVDKIISMIDRQAGGAEFYQSQGLEFESLFTLADIRNN
ncbi:orotate phosphoribosyltransferase [Geminocystis sp. NIES-3709]|uniref:orotate phosphoribosyltransferase n=1 Tax=Geminocystis sp. NIES-3709 TaxID=1617448 RepID=UPI0005FC89BC|nr:orotate phosphoribosyltransferase [Geminocystis sp. NIES-3709]BAQ66526.1 orotate phosphoribosyltransferase [Geminocystis sp. NIES-3709]